MDNPLSYALAAKCPVGCKIEEFVQDTLTSLNTGQQGKQNQVPVAEKPLRKPFHAKSFLYYFRFGFWRP